MFTSDKEKAVRYADKLTETAFLCLAASVFCILFGAIYEVFSHGVYSFYMIYAFAVPLVLGAVPFLAAALSAKRQKDGSLFRLPGTLSIHTWNAGIAALTVGCIFQGVLRIYGTTNRLVIVYPVVGVILLLIGLVSYIMSCKTAERMFRRQMEKEQTKEENLVNV